MTTHIAEMQCNYTAVTVSNLTCELPWHRQHLETVKRNIAKTTHELEGNGLWLVQPRKSWTLFFCQASSRRTLMLPPELFLGRFWTLHAKQYRCRSASFLNVLFWSVGLILGFFVGFFSVLFGAFLRLLKMLESFGKEVSCPTHPLSLWSHFKTFSDVFILVAPVLESFGAVRHLS